MLLLLPLLPVLLEDGATVPLLLAPLALLPKPELAMLLPVPPLALAPPVPSSVVLPPVVLPPVPLLLMTEGRWLRHCENSSANFL